MRRIGVPAAVAAPSRSPAALPIVVSTSVKPSSSRTRKAFTKRRRVSWIRFGVTVSVLMAVLLPLANNVSLANIVSLSTDENLTPRAREIATAARELLEDEGPDGLSMRRLADRLGIRAPSIYKHVPDKEALEDAVISDGFEELAGVLAEASGEGGLEGLRRPTEALRSATRTSTGS